MIWMGGLPTEEAEELVFVIISKSGLEVVSRFYFFMITMIILTHPTARIVQYGQFFEVNWHTFCSLFSAQRASKMNLKRTLFNSNLLKQ
jgi:hypothetical protein